MAAVTTSNPADFADRIQTYFNPKLEKALEFNLVLAPYGMRQAYPANGTSIRFFRPRAANTTGTGTIAEGVTPTTLTEVAVGYVDVALTQRGALAKITDLVQAVDLLNTVSQYVETMGADGALDLDTVVRNALVSAFNDIDATYGANYFDRFAGAANTGDSSVDFATFHALSAANGKLTRTVHMACVTQLKAARVPMIGGRYIVAVAPQVLHDIRLDTTWVSAATQVDNQALYKNGQIMLDGAVFVPNDNPWREGATYKTYSSTGANYSSIYLGANAFGVPELVNKRAGGSPMGPKIRVLADADKADPLNLQTYVGWKAYYGAKPLVTNVSGDVPHYLVLRSKSTFA